MEAPIATKRIQAIDLLRGMVMVVMALDHTRDYFSGYPYSPTDLQHPSAIMFFTRWVTHFCAPVFVFLSGTSAFLASGKASSLRETSFKLLTRGLWLIFIELTIVYYGWTFEVSLSERVLQVIWALGCSMVFLSALVFLPWQAILTIALLMIFGHNAFDLPQSQAGDIPIIWRLLHVQGPIFLGPLHKIFVFYPLIPWLGVMAAGYCMGKLFKLPQPQRDRALFGIGIGAIVLFVMLRFTNLYGDPSPWQQQPTWWATVLSFINCTKYPPSLLYLLMTLGPAITVLPLLEKVTGVVARVFTVYGRVPFFYYVLHIYLIHISAVTLSYFFRGNAPVTIFTHPGYPLYEVYLFWLAVVVALYLPCRWFMGVKMRHRNWWLSYL